MLLYPRRLKVYCSPYTDKNLGQFYTVSKSTDTDFFKHSPCWKNKKKNILKYEVLAYGVETVKIVKFLNIQNY